MCYFKHAMIEPPYYPIVYLRGYAGTQGEIEATVSTPYTGFNLGSTRVRQLHTGEVLPYVFESPVIRLMKDHGYADAYSGGRILPQGPTPSRSIWIFRYYDVADRAFGDGRRREIEFHACKLRGFLRHVRDAVLGEGEDPARFRAYLVAHSMGGLICRCYLQNPTMPDLDGGRSGDWRRKGVDKVFTKLFTAFLMRGARVVRRRRSSGFALRIEIRVPDYDGGGRGARDYYEGGLLFVDKLNVEIARAADGRDRVRYGWDSRTPNRTSRDLALAPDGDALVGRMPFGAPRRIRGSIRVTVTGWNAPPV